MTADAAIISAIFDDYDTVKPVLPQTYLDVEWVMVTDREETAKEAEQLGWRVVVDPQPGLHPNRGAKRPKLFPWWYTYAPASVWVDASFRVVSEAFTVDVLSVARPVAQFVHPWRDCVYDEAAASALPKYAGEPIPEQIDAMRADGFPEHWGLWATGVIARHHTPSVRTMSRVWSAQIQAYSFQDQLSEPVALRDAGLRPALIPGTHFENQWLRYEGSGRH